MTVQMSSALQVSVSYAACDNLLQNSADQDDHVAWTVVKKCITQCSVGELRTKLDITCSVAQLTLLQILKMLIIRDLHLRNSNTCETLKSENSMGMNPIPICNYINLARQMCVTFQRKAIQRSLNGCFAQTTTWRIMYIDFLQHMKSIKWILVGAIRLCFAEHAAYARGIARNLSSLAKILSLCQRW